MTKSKIFVQSLISAVAAALLIATPANANSAIITDPAISVDGDGVVTLTDATWTNSFGVSHSVYSCISPRASATSANPNAISGCYKLFADQSGNPITTGFDLDDAYRSLGGNSYEPYGPLSHGGNLVYVSATGFFDVDPRISASAAYTRQGLTTAPSLSISGSTVTGTIGVITEPNQGSLRFYACDAAFAPGSTADAVRKTVVSVSGGSSPEIPGTNTADGGILISGGPTCVRILDGSPFNLAATQILAGSSYNPAIDGTHIVAAQQLEVVSTGTGNVYYFFSDSVEYIPSGNPVTPVVVMPEFNVASNGVISIQSAPSWTGHTAGSEEIVIKAYLQAVSAVTTPVTGQELNALGSSGNALFDASSTLMNLINPTTLVGAKVLDGSTFVDYDPDIHGRQIVIQAYANYGDSMYAVSTASRTFSGSLTESQPEIVSAPYTGPIINTPAITSSIPAGGKVVIPGNNLSGVSAVEIGGVAATVVVNSDGEIEITVPAGLAAGTYDLVVVSSSGRLTVQNAITVSGSSVGATGGEATPSTKRMSEDSAKVWVFDVVGAGKVQIFVNGKEIAWVRTDNPEDAKLTNGYLVRTVELLPGKNVIEVYVDGTRERRTVYSN